MADVSKTKGLRPWDLCTSRQSINGPLCWRRAAHDGAHQCITYGGKAEWDDKK